MGVAAPQAPFGGWGQGPLKSSVTGPSLLVNCYLEIKFHKKIPIVPPLKTRKYSLLTSNLFDRFNRLITQIRF